MVIISFKCLIKIGRHSQPYLIQIPAESCKGNLAVETMSKQYNSITEK